MTACGKLFESLDKRLEEKKTLDEIGRELCDTVDDPRGKAIRLIKVHKGEEYLIENSDWLGYNVGHIRNVDGENRPKFLVNLKQIKIIPLWMMNADILMRMGYQNLAKLH